MDSSVEYLKGVGPRRGELLRKELNISTFGDILSYYPIKYIDRSKFFKINEIVNDLTYVQLKGEIHSFQTLGAGNSKRMTAYLTDGSGSIELVWFKGLRWLKDRFKPDTEYIVFGKPSVFNNKFNIPHPEIDEVSELQTITAEGLHPYYSISEKLKNNGINSRAFSKLIKTLTVQAAGNISETLSPDILKKFNLINREEALINIHYPSNPSILKKAEARLKFEELFFLQLGLLNIKNIRAKKLRGHVFEKVGYFFNTFYNKYLPFELTNAQKKVVKEIRQDTGSGKQMNRLLQGDVGSGKTLVALLTMLIALDNGFQACMMAPTEILAMQHFDTITRFLNGMDIYFSLLTGSTKNSQRKIIHEDLESGNIQILIGTHALIEENVRFSNLGLVIIDEQHRFGVAQRAKLWKKNNIPPHILVMTATPIPRTLAMTVYGDLDFSVIDELPPGRKQVKTIHSFENKRQQVYQFVHDQIVAGRQVYIVYPLIYESETLDLKHLEEGYQSLLEVFPKFSISIVHGQMKPAEKDLAMQNFKNGETQIMVATTVIEVGVDVPNASVMVIENAERFGLSQLHQLRGRVGRGAEQSFCILLTGYKLTSDARKRIETMVRTSDGFEISEADLKLRGPGDLEGTRQSGILDLRIADIIKDEKILHYARNTAIEVLSDDPNLEKEQNQCLKKQLNSLNKGKNWGIIS